MRLSVVSEEYADRVMVVVSQLNKMGTVLEAWSEPRSEPGGLLYQTRVLMGKRDDPLLHIYARQIIERLSQYSEKPLLLAISLPPETRSAQAFQSILNELFNHNTWS